MGRRYHQLIENFMKPTDVAHATSTQLDNIQRRTRGYSDADSDVRQQSRHSCLDGSFTALIKSLWTITPTRWVQKPFNILRSIWGLVKVIQIVQKANHHTSRKKADSDTVRDKHPNLVLVPNGKPISKVKRLANYLIYHLQGGIKNHGSNLTDYESAQNGTAFGRLLWSSDNSRMS